jgi:hypothetical protein
LYIEKKLNNKFKSYISRINFVLVLVTGQSLPRKVECQRMLEWILPLRALLLEGSKIQIDVACLIGWNNGSKQTQLAEIK